MERDQDGHAGAVLMAFVLGAVCLSAVLDHGQAASLGDGVERVHVRGVSADVDRKNRDGPLRDCVLNRRWV